MQVIRLDQSVKVQYDYANAATADMTGMKMWLYSVRLRGEIRQNPQREEEKSSFCFTVPTIRELSSVYEFSVLF